ncbi:hypothetical protein SCHPADRAFT_962582 [Schizopora paradoxa]|uniref:Ras-domain-containing protein n=1 Tax=Schizopora paradoxa TaxID=27342 RepID=A0A0H2S1P2_9AGAM|nr:hypothetical protein SCHPADRAFT_962582 [Schizopora paradoxa]
MSGYAPLDPYAKSRYEQGIDAKVVVMGNTGVGKTSLLQRYTQNKFDPKNTTSTTGAFFVTKKIYVNGVKVRLQLWDTAGQERFRSMAPMYYRGANAALLLYDITNAATFEDIRGWLEELKKNCSSDLIIYIVGSKADLHNLRQVTSDRVRLSLARWFPPPRPIPPPTPPQQPSTLSYIRPRFTSFTTSRSVPVNQLAPKALDDNSLSRPSELRRSISAVPRMRQEATGAQGLRRANSQNGAATSPQRTKLFDRPFQPSSRFGSSLFGGHSGGYVDTLDESSNSVPEEDEDDDSDSTEWGLEKGMSLFEVSAKDDFGVKQLFDELISAIIERKDIIEKENELKKRDSVMLSPTLTPSWTAQAEEEEKAQLATNSWSCCSI